MPLRVPIPPAPSTRPRLTTARHRDRRRGRAPAVAALAVMTLLSAGCTGSDGPAPSSAGAASAASTSRCTREDTTRCYPLPDILPSYCRVQAARELFADDELTTAELPDWAVTTVRDGTPLIVDFRHPDGTSFVRKVDLLDGFLDGRGLEVKESHVDRCIATTTDADITRTQGGAYVPHVSG